MSSELYLTEYERERQKKIEENKRLLETLGIFESRSVLDASALSLDVKPKRNYIKRPRVPLEPRRSERVSIRPQTTSYAESDDSENESDKPKPKTGVRKLNSYFSVRKTMWKPFYGQEIATCHICLVRNRQPKTKCSRCYADFWRGHVCRGCYEANFTGEEIESFDEARENPNWVCFVCRGICTCKFCRVGSTKRGKRYTKKRPLEEEEALAMQGQAMQIKEERDSDDGQGFLTRKRGRGRPPKSLNNSALLMGSDPGDDEEFEHPLFEGEIDSHYHQLDQLEQLEKLQEQLNQLNQFDQLEKLEMQEREREQEHLRQEQLSLSVDSIHDIAHLHSLQMPQMPLKRGRGRPPKNPQQQQFKRQKYQKHELHKHQLQKHRHHRNKSQEYSDVTDQDKLDQVQVKQEPILDDGLMGHESSLLHDQMALHDHMLMLPEQPMLHEHILQDIPPLQEHPLHLPMLHSQSMQDLPQEHSIQDQLFRDHNSFQNFHSNNFIHHNHHSSHHSLYSHNSSSLGGSSYGSIGPHDPFTHSHFGSHHSLGHHHNSNSSILNTTQSLLIDNGLYQQHPYMFHSYYSYPQSQELQQQQQQEHQQQQLIQQQQQIQQQELRQEANRQEIQRQRQEAQRQEEEDLHLRQHSFHHLSGHHHILNHDDYVQDAEPELPPISRVQESHSRDLVHPSSLLQDSHHGPSADDFYHDEEDNFQSGYDNHQRDHDDGTDDLVDSPSSFNYHDSNHHEHSHNHDLPNLPLHLPLPLSLEFKQEFQHSDLQHREHYNNH